MPCARRQLRRSTDRRHAPPRTRRRRTARRHRRRRRPPPLQRRRVLSLHSGAPRPRCHHAAAPAVEAAAVEAAVGAVGAAGKAQVAMFWATPCRFSSWSEWNHPPRPRAGWQMAHRGSTRPRRRGKAKSCGALTVASTRRNRRRSRRHRQRSDRRRQRSGCLLRCHRSASSVRFPTVASRRRLSRRSRRRPSRRYSHPRRGRSRRAPAATTACRRRRAR